MRALVINTARATERMAFQSRQLDALGVPWERVEAVTPETLSPPSDDPYWTTWQRPLREVEKAVTASHRSAWARVADGPCLILEDDALLMGGTRALLDQLTGVTDADHVSLETRGREKLVGRRHGSAPMVRLWQDYSGAAAYVLWPAGARILLEESESQAGIADAIICAAYRLRSWQADPAMAIQFDQCADYGIDTPVATPSSVLAEPRPDGCTKAQRQRRIAGQLRIVARRLSLTGRATRRPVPLAQDGSLVNRR